MALPMYSELLFDRLQGVGVEHDLRRPVGGKDRRRAGSRRRAINAIKSIVEASLQCRSSITSTMGHSAVSTSMASAIPRTCGLASPP